MKRSLRWKRTRLKMCRARMATGELDCPCCGRIMYFIKLESWDCYAARYENTYSKPPSGWPDDIQASIASLDHLVPRVRGGTDHANNLFVMCVTCNGEKDNKTAREWIAWRKLNGRPLDDVITARLLRREKLAWRVCGT